MASHLVFPPQLIWHQWEFSPSLTLLQYFFVTLLFFFLALSSLLSSKFSHLKDIPVVNKSSAFPFSREKARRKFVNSGKQLINTGRKLFPHKPFRLLTDLGEVLILPPQFANEIRNDSRLSFGLAAMQDNHAHIPGFQPVGVVGRTDQLIQIVARKQLTKHLSKVIRPLSEETEFALKLNFGDSTAWQTVHLKGTVLDIISRISSRIYLGEQLCRNEDWLRTTKSYTAAFFVASTELRMYPRLLRPLVHWFLPSCRTLREGVKEAHRIIGGLIDKRRKQVEEAVAAGEAVPKLNDSVTWAEEEAARTGTTYDPAEFQLTLALLAIHTTFDLLEQCMLDLAKNPEFIEPLRSEVLQVLRTDGWTKNSLYNMKLLDSAIKESQRLKPGSLATMRRYVTENMELSNAIPLKRGSRINVDGYRMMDPNLHENPDKYDAFRFFKMRSQPGREYMAQLSATSVDHLGFGHGEHSCPGRFFASNEIKVALCHILAKYEWKLAPNTTIVPDTKGMICKASSVARILVRKREHIELDIDLL